MLSKIIPQVSRLKRNFCRTLLRTNWTNSPGPKFGASALQTRNSQLLAHIPVEKS
jgi:hypothetical protein